MTHLNESLANLHRLDGMAVEDGMREFVIAAIRISLPACLQGGVAPEVLAAALPLRAMTVCS